MFRVGQKVVCVDDANNSGLGGVWADAPVKGQVYTVTRSGLTHPSDPRQLPCVLLAEIYRDEDGPLWAHRFRPIVERKTDISVFTAMLNTKKMREPVDAQRS